MSKQVGKSRKEKFDRPPELARTTLGRLVAIASEGVYILAKLGLEDPLLADIPAIAERAANVEFFIIFPRTSQPIPQSWQRLVGLRHCHLMVTGSMIQQSMVLVGREHGFVVENRAKTEITITLLLNNARERARYSQTFLECKRFAEAFNGGR